MRYEGHRPRRSPSPEGDGEIIWLNSSVLLTPRSRQVPKNSNRPNTLHYSLSHISTSAPVSIRIIARWSRCEPQPSGAARGGRVVDWLVCQHLSLRKCSAV